MTNSIFRKAVETWRNDLCAIHTGYEVCLWQEGITRESDKIYFEVTSEGLKYYVGENSATIPKNQVNPFGDKVINQLTEDDLQTIKLYLYEILVITANAKHTRSVSTIGFERVTPSIKKKLSSINTTLPDITTPPELYADFANLIIQIGINVSSILIKAENVGLKAYFFNPLNASESLYSQSCDTFLKTHLASEILNKKTYDLAAIYLKYLTAATEDQNFMAFIKNNTKHDLEKDKENLILQMKKFRDEQRVHIAHSPLMRAKRESYRNHARLWKKLYKDLEDKIDSSNKFELHKCLSQFKKFNDALIQYPSEILKSSSYLRYLKRPERSNESDKEHWQKLLESVGQLEWIRPRENYEKGKALCEVAGAKLKGCNFAPCNNESDPILDINETPAIDFEGLINKLKAAHIHCEYQGGLVEELEQQLDEYEDLIQENSTVELISQINVLNKEKYYLQRWNLYYKYFIKNPHKDSNKSSGIFFDYLAERNITYCWYDMFQSWIALLLGSFFYKTDKQARKEYVDSLQLAAKNYQTNPDIFALQLQETIQSGQKKTGIYWQNYYFYPRRSENSNEPYSDKSLQAKLEQFKKELNAIERHAPILSSSENCYSTTIGGNRSA